MPESSWKYSFSQNFRDELTRAYRDIDQLKKFRQKNGMKMQQLERFISRLDLELIEVSLVVLISWSHDDEDDDAYRRPSVR